jgi:hypothetical protein
MVLNFWVATQTLARKAFCCNHETIICLMVLNTCVYLHFINPLKCNIRYAGFCFLFYACFMSGVRDSVTLINSGLLVKSA